MLFLILFYLLTCGTASLLLRITFGGVHPQSKMMVADVGLVAGLFGLFPSFDLLMGKHKYLFNLSK